MKPSKKKSLRKNRIPATITTKLPIGKIVVIVGATASGKSTLAIKLAKKFNGEIISADSRQIYCWLDIGTAKPTLKQRRAVPHHLIDIRNPNQTYTAAQYKRDCLRAIRQILKKNKLPIIVGGTGLYVKAVVDNLTIPQVKADPLLRKELEEELNGRGLNFLYNELIKLDPEAAYTVDPNNPRRVIRALEITMNIKKPFSQTRRQGKPLFNFFQIGVNLPKEKLRERIDRRIDGMIKEGLVNEVKNLTKKYPAGISAFEAIGYREIINHLQGETSLKEAVELMKKNSWRFAKRQLTWFRKDKRIRWVSSEKQAEKLIQAFMKHF